MQSPTKCPFKVRPPVSKLTCWTCDDVKSWMIDAGFGQYASLFAEKHKIDGLALTLLCEQDLRQPPLQLSVLGDMKRLIHAIAALVDRSNAQHVNKVPVPVNLYQSPNPTALNGSVSSNSQLNRLNQLQYRTPSSKDKIFDDEWFIANVEAPDTPGTSFIKALIACVYCMISLLITALVMVIVHDRVPDMKTYPPLPDIFLDNVPLIPWAFQVCEVIACLLLTIWCLILLFHKWRLVLFRRMFSLTGTVFGLRCVTMLITSLSVPGIHLDCKSPGHASWSSKFQQAFEIWSGMGLSLRGVRSCGDYMFSGHTTAITLLNHFITEYTPDDWKVLSTVTWVLNLFGIFFILAGHEHYSIDVFVAFYLSSRIFLYYHLMANQAPHGRDQRSRIWFPLFWFFESGTHGRVAHEYDWPVKWADIWALGQGLVGKLSKSKAPQVDLFDDDDKLVDWIEGNNNEDKVDHNAAASKPVKRKPKKNNNKSSSTVGF